MSNTVVVSSRQGHAFLQEIRAGNHTVLADEPTSVGGTDLGPNPKELVLAALGACTAMTLQMLAARKGWDLQKVTVTVSEQLVADPANAGKQITQITEQINIVGNLAAAEVKRLESAASACPVYKLLTGPKQVLTSLQHTPPVVPGTASGSGTAPAAGSGTP